jgi:hypothetical protein
VTVAGHQFRLVEASQEALRDAEEFGGAAHGVGGVVLVVELVADGLRVRIHSTSTWRGPRCRSTGAQAWGLTPSTDDDAGSSCPRGPPGAGDSAEIACT